MSTYIKTLKNSNGDIIYPRTKITAIYDDNSVGLQTILDNLQTAVNTPQFSCVTTTLTGNSWENYSQTITVPGVTATNLAIISPEYSFAREYQVCGIYAYSQDTNSITFHCNSVPNGSIVINILIINAAMTDYRPENYISVIYNGNAVTDDSDLGNVEGNPSFTITSDRNLEDITVTGTNIGSYSWSGSTLTVTPGSYAETDTSLTLSVAADVTHVGCEVSFSWVAVKYHDYINVVYNGNSVQNASDLGSVGSNIVLSVSSNRSVGDIDVSGTNINGYSWSGNTLTINTDASAGTDMLVTLTLLQSAANTGCTFEFTCTRVIEDTIIVYWPLIDDVIQNEENIGNVSLKNSEYSDLDSVGIEANFRVETNVLSSSLVVSHSNLDDVTIHTEVENDNILYIQVYKTNSDTNGIFTISISTPSLSGHIPATFNFSMNVLSGIDFSPV